MNLSRAQMLQFVQNVERGNIRAAGAALRAIVLGEAGAALSYPAGTGITSAADLYKYGIQKVGDIILTRIIIDIDGLNSSATGDIIGANGAANCHLGQIDFSRCGTPISGRMQCLEVPATGDTDIDVHSADEATGTEDAAASGLTNDTTLVAAGGALTAGTVYEFTSLPSNLQYLYLVAGGAGADATYTAGKLLIELEGYDA